MNVLSTIAAAVAAGLSAASLPQACTVQRCFVPPDYDTAADTSLKVLVLGLDEEVNLQGGTRVVTRHDYGVRVAIIKRVAAADVSAPAALAELDALGDFREAVIDYLKANARMGDGSLQTIKSANGRATYDPAALDQKKTYVAVVTATYLQLR